jgi:hypothetical protein
MKPLTSPRSAAGSFVFGPGKRLTVPAFGVGAFRADPCRLVRQVKQLAG